MALSRKPHRYGLDAFIMVDTARANYYYGRADVEPDTEDGEKRAILAAARGESVVLDPTLPWILIARGMYRFLYRDAERERDRRMGRASKKKNRGYNESLPRAVRITPQRWAEAFNIVMVGFIENEFLRKPEKRQMIETASGRKVSLALVSQSPGRGRAKTNDYLAADRRSETIKVLRRMERHRLELLDNSDVVKHLASLRTGRGV